MKYMTSGFLLLKSRCFLNLWGRPAAFCPMPRCPMAFSRHQATAHIDLRKCGLLHEGRVKQLGGIGIAWSPIQLVGDDWSNMEQP